MTANLDTRTARLAVVGITLAYTFAHLAWYGTTPMGAFPVLDGREILDLAGHIANGTVPPEPFYRAPLYSALLALISKLGAPPSFLPDAARLLNLLAHCISTVLVFELARRMWQKSVAGLLAGALYGLYPVAIHFASDPLDVSLGTALALLGTLTAWLAWERRSVALAFAAAFSIALAALARPNFLLCLPALFLWLGLIVWRDKSHARLLLGATAGVALVFAAMGIINLRVGGEFRILPWQGSHSFWDGNGPNANGLFYTHSIQLTNAQAGQNPSRAEAELIYCQDRPCNGKLDIDDFQSYWRARMLTHLQQQPAAAAELMASKLWYLINNYEQYNNKTYWVHKERSAWLRWNPLCWALLLGLASAALWLPLKREARELLLLTLVCYAMSLLLVFVSARFRVPMAGWLCVLAGGWATMLAQGWLVPSNRRAIVAMLMTGLAVGALAAVPINEELRNSTVVEDHLLMSGAALSAGKWQESEMWAQQALAKQPNRPIAHVMVCSTRLYAWEMSADSALPPQSWLQDSLDHCQAGIQKSDDARYSASLFMAGLCQQQGAISMLESQRDSKTVGDLARGALALLGREPSAGANSGLYLLKSKRPEEVTPGQRSMLDALFGVHCKAFHEPASVEALP